MTVGSGQLFSGDSYISVGRETTLGTYNTATAALPSLSFGLATTKERKILEQIETSRTYSKSISMSKSVAGDAEYYYYPQDDASNFILQQAFGGAITSATATGETVGGLAFTHEVVVGDMDLSYTSLCFNVRRGKATSGKISEYSGVRVNEITFTAEIDDALKMSASMIGMDSSITTNDVASALTVTSSDVLNFDSGRISVESTFAGLTTTSFWHVQSMEFGLSNNLKSESESRRIGSDILQVLPAGIASFTFNATIRFDTTTAYDAMLAGTQLAADFEFLGDTITTSLIRQGLKLQMPKVFVMESTEPEISGPDAVLTSEVAFAVLRDDSSATGFAVKALITNNTSSYA